MKKLSFLLLILVLGLINTAYSQPKFTITLTGGYGVPLGDFKVAVPPTSPLTETNRADADFFPYYTKQLMNFGLEGKLAIGKKGNFRVTFGVGYNMFSNSTDAVFRIDTNNTLGVITFKPKVNIITLALGGEWAFMPKGKINPCWYDR